MKVTEGSEEIRRQNVSEGRGEDMLANPYPADKVHKRGLGAGNRPGRSVEKHAQPKARRIKPLNEG